MIMPDPVNNFAKTILEEIVPTTDNQFELVKNTDRFSLLNLIKNLKKNNLQEQMNRLLQEQKNIEQQKNDNANLKEVDIKVMEIALKIVEIRKMLQSL